LTTSTIWTALNSSLEDFDCMTWKPSVQLAASTTTGTGLPARRSSARLSWVSYPFKKPFDFQGVPQHRLPVFSVVTGTPARSHKVVNALGTPLENMVWMQAGR